MDESRLTENEYAYEEQLIAKYVRSLSLSLPRAQN